MNMESCKLGDTVTEYINPPDDAETIVALRMIAADLKANLAYRKFVMENIWYQDVSEQMRARLLAAENSLLNPKSMEILAIAFLFFKMKSFDELKAAGLQVDKTDGNMVLTSSRLAALMYEQFLGTKTQKSHEAYMAVLVKGWELLGLIRKEVRRDNLHEITGTPLLDELIKRYKATNARAITNTLISDILDINSRPDESSQ